MNPNELSQNSDRQENRNLDESGSSNVSIKIFNNNDDNLVIRLYRNNKKTNRDKFKKTLGHSRQIAGRCGGKEKKKPMMLRNLYRNTFGPTLDETVLVGMETFQICQQAVPQDQQNYEKYNKANEYCGTNRSNVIHDEISWDCCSLLPTNANYKQFENVCTNTSNYLLDKQPNLSSVTTNQSQYKPSSIKKQNSTYEDGGSNRTDLTSSNEAIKKFKERNKHIDDACCQNHVSSNGNISKHVSSEGINLSYLTDITRSTITDFKHDNNKILASISTYSDNKDLSYVVSDINSQQPSTSSKSYIPESHTICLKKSDTSLPTCSTVPSEKQFDFSKGQDKIKKPIQKNEESVTERINSTCSANFILCPESKNNIFSSQSSRVDNEQTENEEISASNLLPKFEKNSKVKQHFFNYFLKNNETAKNTQPTSAAVIYKANINNKVSLIKIKKYNSDPGQKRYPSSQNCNKICLKANSSTITSTLVLSTIESTESSLKNKPIKFSSMKQPISPLLMEQAKVKISGSRINKTSCWEQQKNYAYARFTQSKAKKSPLRKYSRLYAGSDRPKKKLHRCSSTSSWLTQHSIKNNIKKLSSLKKKEILKKIQKIENKPVLKVKYVLSTSTSSNFSTSSSTCSSSSRFPETQRERSGSDIKNNFYNELILMRKISIPIDQEENIKFENTKDCSKVIKKKSSSNLADKMNFSEKKRLNNSDIMLPPSESYLQDSSGNTKDSADPQKQKNDKYKAIYPKYQTHHGRTLDNSTNTECSSDFQKQKNEDFNAVGLNYKPYYDQKFRKRSGSKTASFDSKSSESKKKYCKSTGVIYSDPSAIEICPGLKEVNKVWDYKQRERAKRKPLLEKLVDVITDYSKRVNSAHSYKYCSCDKSSKKEEYSRKVPQRTPFLQKIFDVFSKKTIKSSQYSCSKLSNDRSTSKSPKSICLSKRTEKNSCDSECFQISYGNESEKKKKCLVAEKCIETEKCNLIECEEIKKICLNKSTDMKQNVEEKGTLCTNRDFSKSETFEVCSDEGEANMTSDDNLCPAFKRHKKKNQSSRDELKGKIICLNKARLKKQNKAIRKPSSNDFEKEGTDKTDKSIKKYPIFKNRTNKKQLDNSDIEENIINCTNKTCPRKRRRHSKDLEKKRSSSSKNLCPLSKYKERTQQKKNTIPAKKKTSSNKVSRNKKSKETLKRNTYDFKEIECKCQEEEEEEEAAEESSNDQTDGRTCYSISIKTKNPDKFEAKKCKCNSEEETICFCDDSFEADEHSKDKCDSSGRNSRCEIISSQECPSSIIYASVTNVKNNKKTNSFLYGKNTDKLSELEKKMKIDSMRKSTREPKSSIICKNRPSKVIENFHVNVLSGRGDMFSTSNIRKKKKNKIKNNIQFDMNPLMAEVIDKYYLTKYNTDKNEEKIHQKMKEKEIQTQKQDFSAKIKKPLMKRSFLENAQKRKLPSKLNPPKSAYDIKIQTANLKNMQQKLNWICPICNSKLNVNLREKINNDYCAFRNCWEKNNFDTHYMPRFEEAATNTRFAGGSSPNRGVKKKANTVEREETHLILNKNLYCYSNNNSSEENLSKSANFKTTDLRSKFRQRSGREKSLSRRSTKKDKRASIISSNQLISPNNSCCEENAFCPAVPEDFQKSGRRQTKAKSYRASSIKGDLEEFAARKSNAKSFRASSIKENLPIFEPRVSNARSIRPSSAKDDFENFNTRPSIARSIRASAVQDDLEDFAPRASVAKSIRASNVQDDFQDFAPRTSNARSIRASCVPDDFQNFTPRQSNARSIRASTVQDDLQDFDPRASIARSTRASSVNDDMQDFAPRQSFARSIRASSVKDDFQDFTPRKSAARSFRAKSVHEDEQDNAPRVSTVYNRSFSVQEDPQVLTPRNSETMSRKSRRSSSRSPSVARNSFHEDEAILNTTTGEDPNTSFSERAQSLSNNPRRSVRESRASRASAYADDINRASFIKPRSSSIKSNKETQRKSTFIDEDSPRKYSRRSSTPNPSIRPKSFANEEYMRTSSIDDIPRLSQNLPEFQEIDQQRSRSIKKSLTPRQSVRDERASNDEDLRRFSARSEMEENTSGNFMRNPDFDNSSPRTSFIKERAESEEKKPSIFTFSPEQLRQSVAQNPRKSSAVREDDRNKTPQETRYAITRVTKYSDYTTYEVLKSTRAKPKKIPQVLEKIFIEKDA